MIHLPWKIVLRLIWIPCFFPSLSSLLVSIGVLCWVLTNTACFQTLETTSWAIPRYYPFNHISILSNPLLSLTLSSQQQYKRRKHGIEEWSFLSLCNSITHPKSSITFISEQEMNPILHSLHPLLIHTSLHPILMYIPCTPDPTTIRVIPSPCWIALVIHDSPSTNTLRKQQHHYHHNNNPFKPITIPSFVWRVFADYSSFFLATLSFHFLCEIKECRTIRSMRVFPFVC